MSIRESVQKRVLLALLFVLVFVYILLGEMLATHILIHTFQHIFFNWLNSTWNLPHLYETHLIWWDHMNFNQSKRVCWKVVLKSVLLALELSKRVARPV